MSELSIRAAAREAPDAPALITLARTYTFGELAALAAKHEPARGAEPTPLCAAPTLQSVLDLYAHLDAQRPVAMLHHKLSRDARAAQADHANRAVPDGTLAVLFTSGSTGTPRGVILSRAAFLASARASAAHLGARAGDAWLVALPLAHTGGLAALLRALVHRIPAVFLDRDFDPAATRLLLARATLASLVPTQLEALLDDAAWRPSPTLRAILLGGAAAPAPLLARAAARGVPFLTTYGMTETWGQVATQSIDRAGDPHAPLVPLPDVSITAGTIDHPAPIKISTPTRMTSYLDLPEDGGRKTEVETRDLGWLSGDGCLHIVGRTDDVIISGGENVHPALVEDILATAPGVAACCAFGAPDARWGQIVVAAVVPAPDFDADLALAHCAARLAPHQRPRRLIATPSLPLGPTGKIDRRACARLATP
ncbi:MAG TPA: fatty acid--CoA ligase family protein [Kofleriaceae bacterium]|nr:fatty acid--CoA ligase family protein [Kofleriaceae bacterium]